MWNEPNPSTALPDPEQENKAVGAVLFSRPCGALQGEAWLPGDKSLSHRAALLGAMAEGESRIENFLVSGVTRAMLDALTELGVAWRLEGTSLAVQGVGLGQAGGSPVKAGVTLNCGNSATTLRLLAGALAAWGARAVLDGSVGLRRRPMRRIVEPLQQMGVDIQAAEGGAPLVLRPAGWALRATACRLPIASAQVKSCLLLAGLAADGPLSVSEPGPSRDHTERMLRSMGVSVTTLSPSGGDTPEWVTRLTPPQPRRLEPLHVRLPGDLSAAAFLIVAALIVPGSHIRLHGVGLNPTRTGLLDTLIEMGGHLQVTPTGEQGGEPVGEIEVRYSRLKGVEVYGERVVRMIDEFPIFAVAAAFAQGTTVVRDALELRHKESDRITALGDELRRLGVSFTETPDGFVVTGRQPLEAARPDSDGSGGPPAPIVCHSQGDHRIAMSLAVTGLAWQAAVGVREAEMIHESFPGFVHTLQGMGAELEWREDTEPV